MPYVGIDYPFSHPAFALSNPQVTITEVISPPANGFPISIAGHEYAADTSFEPYRREAFRHKSIQAQRQSMHYTNIPDDGTISTEGLWRREARDWSLGSGQIYFDRHASNDARFAHSKGINPWMQWNATLQPDVTQQHNSTNSNVKAITVGNYVFTADGSSITYQTAWNATPTNINPTAVAGWVPAPILDICTNGFWVFFVTKYGVFQYIPGTNVLSVIVESSDPSYTNANGYAGFTYPWLAANSSLPLSAKLGFAGDRLILILNNVKPWNAALQASTTSGCNVFDLSYHITQSTNIVGTVSGTTYTFQGPTNFVVNQYVDLYSPSWALPGATLGLLTKQIVTSVNVDTTAGNATPQFTVTITGTAPTGTGYNITATASNGTPLPSAQGNEWLYTHPNPNWIMTALSAGNAMIYMAGHPMDTSGASPVATGPGIVYRMGITSSSASNSPTAQYLSYPVQALPMPVGEWPTAMYCYLNYIFVGSNRGIRMAQTINAYDPVGNAGDLKAGPLIPDISEVPSAPVSAITGDDRYIYWGWNNYDNVSTGLGRLDLTTFIEDLGPAYASDLMVYGQGPSSTGALTWLDWDPITNSPLMSFNSLSLVSTGMSVTSKVSGSTVTLTFTGPNHLVAYQSVVVTNASIGYFNGTWTVATATSAQFTVTLTTTSWTHGALSATGATATIASGGYVFTAAPNSSVAFGTIDSGLITYGIPDYKNAMSIDLNVNNVQGNVSNSSVDFQLSVDNGDYFDLGSYNGDTPKSTLYFSQQFGEQYRILTTLTPSVGGALGVNPSPELNRWTLKALPGIPSGILISAVILLYEPVEMDNQTVHLDPYAEYSFLENLRQLQQVVTYVEGPFVAQVTIDMLDWLPERRRSINPGGYHGDLVVYMKTVTG